MNIFFFCWEKKNKINPLPPQKKISETRGETWHEREGCISKSLFKWREREGSVSFFVFSFCVPWLIRLFLVPGCRRCCRRLQRSTFSKSLFVCLSISWQKTKMKTKQKEIETFFLLVCFTRTPSFSSCCLLCWLVVRKEESILFPSRNLGFVTWDLGMNRNSFTWRYLEYGIRNLFVFKFITKCSTLLKRKRRQKGIDEFSYSKEFQSRRTSQHAKMIRTRWCSRSQKYVFFIRAR